MNERIAGIQIDRLMGTSFEAKWDEEDAEETARLKKLAEKAEAEPSFDYFEHARSKRPKYDIGKYVANHGFNVPLIRTEGQWRDAFEAGRLMLRSELVQDYDGYSGLFASTVISRSSIKMALGISGTEQFRTELTDLLINAISHGDLSPWDYMHGYQWRRDRHEIDEQKRFGLDLYDYFPSVTPWRYITGTNIRMFRDPSVEGRYHLGADHGGIGREGVYRIDIEDLGRGVSLERTVFTEDDNLLHIEGPTIVFADLVAYYESIRTLPLFDARQAPVLELVADDEGEIYFLQYLKTGHLLEPAEHFELPGSEVAILSDDARGATEPEGRKFKVYLDVKDLGDFVPGEAVFVSDAISDQGLQVLCQLSDLIILDGPLCFKDNHYDSAPLYRPKLGIGIWAARQQPSYKILDELDTQLRSERLWGPPTNDRYFIEAHVTSNGREATIESDWVLKSEAK